MAGSREARGDRTARWRELRGRRRGDRAGLGAPEPDAEAAIAAVRREARPLTGGPQDFDPLLEIIGDARVVLLGESTHGTHDFYRVRAEITKRLIREKGFAAVAVEADWPDAYRVNRFVRGADDLAESVDALDGFKRFPTWMWRNADVLDFVGWLRAHNESGRGGAPEVGFYGLDLYNLHASMQAVLEFLERVDPEEARRARERYGCFDRFGEDPQSYGYAAHLGLMRSCREVVIAQLEEIERREAEYARRARGRAPSAELFYAEQSARLVRNAEEYYRTMFSGQVSSWNLRDRHMVETLRALIEYLDRSLARAKVVVWAHNSHVGDAAATEMAAIGEWNLGELVRDQVGADAVLVGFSTHQGTVTAASAWGGPAERKHVRPALDGSYERLFHDAGVERFLLDLRGGDGAVSALRSPRLERAIGVLYLPETERQSHYLYAVLPEQFDAVLHYDQTRAVEPLERTSLWEKGELPETYPFGV